MKKLIFLGPFRDLPKKGIELITKLQDQKIIDFSAIVTEDEHLTELRTVLPEQQIHTISSKKRNEEEILYVIKKENINLLISLQHPWIISKKILEAVNGNAFNIHLGKLPEYRGHHPQIYAILNGDQFYHTTLHWMSPEVDRGYAAYINSFEILDQDT